jgi:anti-sigma factor RsiW
VSAICGILRESFDDYLADRLPEAQRRILREHLASCAGCSAAAAARDASFVFARSLSEDVAPGETAAILAAVRTGVGHIETERRVAGAGSGRRRTAVAAAAAAALLALTVAGGSARHEVAVAALPTLLPSPAPAAEAAVAGLEPAALPAEAGSVPSNATVYDLNPGAGREEPRVVWIVDRGLDI